MYAMGYSINKSLLHQLRGGEKKRLKKTHAQAGGEQSPQQVQAGDAAASLGINPSHK
jgi:hypothetical protein